MRATGTVTCPQAGRLPFYLLTHSRFYSLNKHTSLPCAWHHVDQDSRVSAVVPRSCELGIPVQRLLMMPLGTGGPTGGDGWAGPEKDLGQCGQEAWGGREEGPFLEGLRAEVGFTGQMGVFWTETRKGFQAEGPALAKMQV